MSGEEDHFRSSDKCEEGRCCNVLIIGAGVAGLSAANHLLKNNVKDLLILEARNRIGGRVIAINIEGRQLELGANWIHGILGNPIYELASANGLVPIVQQSRPHTVLATTQNGIKLPFAILQEMYEVYSVFLKRCEEYFLCSYLPPEGVKSVGQHLRLERDLYLQQFTQEHQRQQRQLVFDYLMTREACITGVDLDSLDLLEVGSYTELPGGNISLPGGYSSILRPLANDIPPEIILKNHPVAVVRWDTSTAHEQPAVASATVDASTSAIETNETSPLDRRKVEVVCDDGKIFYTNSVICTVPLGVLKMKASSMFNPSLPTSKVESIEKLCYGTVDKIYLEYERPFLSAELVELILLWEPTDVTEDMSKRWYRKIYSFTKLSETLLLGWVSGEEAKYMETLPFDAVSDQCTDILRQFLDDPCVPKPKRCICTSWWSQPYSRGSYTSIGVGAQRGDIVNLSTPVYACPNDPLPSLQFAGEHCHPSFYSTVHGAYLSGRDAAKHLCSLPAIHKSQSFIASQMKQSGTGDSDVASGQTTNDGSGDTESQALVGASQPSSEAHDYTLSVEGTADLSTWLHGISLK